MRRRAARLLLALLGTGCGARQAAPPPLVVIGVDGGDRKVIEALWARGELPALRKLAEAGSFLPLRTAYAKSPVIWTTIATGVAPEEHGIQDFVVATPRGDVPVSSATRRRPALWNQLERVGRTSATLGWWATWPAEAVKGSVVVSDRAGLGLVDEISPPERAGDLARWVAEAKSGGLGFGDTGAAEIHYRVVTLAATELVRGPFDLILAYYRSVDIVCHWQWHTFQTAKFPGGPPAGAAQATSAEPVFDVYRSVDAAIGRIAAAAPPGTSFLVLSDHGFHAERKADVAIHLDFDRVLEALGFLERSVDGAIDARRSTARTHLSPPFRQVKLVRLRDQLPRDERSATIERLRAGLARVRFPDGSRAFAPRAP
ncbi:MAG TPA: alkaline phosphatase family protein, partial [Thermoanaerobaculia bacterium]|nr:alkaline phosphatase family protein [Thermoanaerobaculia bacterium]